MNAATRLFATPELCALIFEHLPLHEIFPLQNLTRGVRLHIHDYNPWRTALFDKDAVAGCPTVKPTLPEGEDAKTVEWVYTNGPAKGERIPEELGLWPDSRSLHFCESTSNLWRELTGRRNASMSNHATVCRPSNSAEAGPSRQPNSSSLDGQAESRHNEVERFIRQATGVVNTLRVQRDGLWSDDSIFTRLVPETCSPHGAVRPADSTIATQASVATSTLPQQELDRATAPHVYQGRLPSPRAITQLRPRPRLGTNQYQLQFVQLNWFLKDKFPRWVYYPISNMLGLEEPLPTTNAFTNHDASYRSLLLVVPPLSELIVMDCKGGMFEVSNEQGITMGDVVDAVLGGCEFVTHRSMVLNDAP